MQKFKQHFVCPRPAATFLGLRESAPCPEQLETVHRWYMLLYFMWTYMHLILYQRPWSAYVMCASSIKMVAF